MSLCDLDWGKTAAATAQLIYLGREKNLSSFSTLIKENGEKYVFMDNMTDPVKRRKIYRMVYSSIAKQGTYCLFCIMCDYVFVCVCPCVLFVCVW